MLRHKLLHIRKYLVSSPKLTSIINYNFHYQDINQLLYHHYQLELSARPKSVNEEFVGGADCEGLHIRTVRFGISSISTPLSTAV